MRNGARAVMTKGFSVGRCDRASCVYMRGAGRNDAMLGLRCTPQSPESRKAAGHRGEDEEIRSLGSHNHVVI
jgi:hypothetical protein